MLTDFVGHAFPSHLLIRLKRKKVLTSEEINIETKGSSHKAPRSHQFNPLLLIFLRFDFFIFLSSPPHPFLLLPSLFLPELSSSSQGLAEPLIYLSVWGCLELPFKSDFILYFICRPDSIRHQFPKEKKKKKKVNCCMWV